MLSFALIVAILFPQPSDAAGKERRAKYVFYFIGDGMGMNQVNGTEMYMAEKEGRIGTKPLNFTQFPVTNFATTYSVFNSVTCSAAAGTALATGEKTKHGTIGMDRERQKPLYSVAVKAKESGMKVGIATNNSVDHATPASFYAHQPDRNMAYEIACDLPKAGFDYYAGAGFVRPVNDKDKNAPNVYDLFDKAGYTVAKGYADFVEKGKTAEKIILIQKDGCDMESLPYAIDRQPGDMTLEEITAGAIDFLSKDNKNGFFMMIESGLIDWACHSNDAATVFHEVIDFQKSIQKALDFYAEHPDETLIVVTADHETGGMALGTGGYELNLKVLENQKVSKGGLSKKISALRIASDHHVSWDEVKQLLSDNLGLWSEAEVKESYENDLKSRYKKAFEDGDTEKTRSLYAEDEPLASTAVYVLNRIAAVSWASGGHSAGYVPVFVIGTGAELFNGKLDNTDIPKRIEAAMKR